MVCGKPLLSLLFPISWGWGGVGEQGTNTGGGGTDWRHVKLFTPYQKGALSLAHSICAVKRSSHVPGPRG